MTLSVDSRCQALDHLSCAKQDQHFGLCANSRSDPSSLEVYKSVAHTLHTGIVLGFSDMPLL